MKGRVYVVDDDAQVRRSTCFLLNSHDYQCRSFADGEAFLHEMEDLPPGCVLLDMYMPGSSGLDVQAALAHKGLQMPVIVMTGHADEAVTRNAMDRGAVNMLEKPFPEEDLLSALKECFAQLDAARKNAPLS